MVTEERKRKTAELVEQILALPDSDFDLVYVMLRATVEHARKVAKSDKRGD